MIWKMAPLLALLAGSVAWAGSVEPVQGVQPPGASIASEADEALLKERVLARWQALIRGDFDAAYQFETPAYRAIYTPIQFRYQFGNQTLWREAKITNIHYDGSIVARVRVEIAYRYVDPQKGSGLSDLTQQVSEVWLYKEGQWWHQQN